MLLRHGHVVAEGWWFPYKRNIPHILHSLTKGFVSTAVGFAIAEDLFSINNKIVSFFPDETPNEVSNYLDKMTVQHLLMMATGHGERMDALMSSDLDGNWVEVFLKAPVVYEPGSRYQYDDGVANMMAAIMRKTTGMPLIDYLTPRLLEPLGIESANWLAEFNETNVHGGYGLDLTTEDIARFGQLYLQKGVWQEKRILPESWIDEATAWHIENGTNPDSDWEQGYGYFFQQSRHDTYRVGGAFGQFCIIMPNQDAVLAITAGTKKKQNILDAVWDILLPSMEDAPLREDEILQEQLQQKIASLRLVPVKGQTKMSFATQISGRPFRVKSNLRNIETITLNFNQSSCVITFQTSKGEEKIPCGYSKWQYGQTTLFENVWDLIIGVSKVAASGAW